MLLKPQPPEQWGFLEIYCLYFRVVLDRNYFFGVLYHLKLIGQCLNYCALVLVLVSVMTKWMKMIKHMKSYSKSDAVTGCTQMPLIVSYNLKVTTF